MAALFEIYLRRKPQVHSQMTIKEVKERHQLNGVNLLVGRKFLKNGSENGIEPMMTLNGFSTKIPEAFNSSAECQAARRLNKGTVKASRVHPHLNASDMPICRLRTD